MNPAVPRAPARGNNYSSHHLMFFFQNWHMLELA
jgi:hypothetical protein